MIASKSSEQQLGYNKLNAVLNKAGIFDVESPTTRPEIGIKRIVIKLEQDEIRILTSLVAMQEMFVKTVLNLVDISNVKKFERLVQPSDRKVFFDKKRKLKGKPLALLVQVEDVYMQVFGKTSGKKIVQDEILKLRLH